MIAFISFRVRFIYLFLFTFWLECGIDFTAAGSSYNQKTATEEFFLASVLNHEESESVGACGLAGIFLSAATKMPATCRKSQTSAKSNDIIELSSYDHNIRFNFRDMSLFITLGASPESAFKVDLLFKNIKIGCGSSNLQYVDRHYYWPLAYCPRMGDWAKQISRCPLASQNEGQQIISQMKLELGCDVSTLRYSNFLLTAYNSGLYYANKDTGFEFGTSIFKHDIELGYMGYNWVTPQKDDSCKSMAKLLNDKLLLSTKMFHHQHKEISDLCYAGFKFEFEGGYLWLEFHFNQPSLIVNYSHIQSKSQMSLYASIKEVMISCSTYSSENFTYENINCGDLDHLEYQMSSSRNEVFTSAHTKDNLISATTNSFFKPSFMAMSSRDHKASLDFNNILKISLAEKVLLVAFPKRGFMIRMKSGEKTDFIYTKKVTL